MHFLTIQTKDGETFRFDLRAPATRIGRFHDNDLILRDEAVSRHHARIEHRDGGDFILDVNSKSGTIVNQREIQAPKRLGPGDSIRLGTTTLTYDGVPSSPIVFDDGPLSADLATTFVSGDEVLTPPPLSMQGAPTIEVPGILNFVLEADRQLALHRPINELYETILDLGHQKVPFERGAILTFEGAEPVTQISRVPPDEIGEPIRISRTIATRVLQENASVLIRDALDETELVGTESIRSQHLRSVMCVPLRIEERIIGLLYVDNRKTAGAFELEDLDVLRHLGSIAAVKIEQWELMKEAEVAARQRIRLAEAVEIQQHLFPEGAPAIASYRLAGMSRPCEAVGGDYFDYLELPGGRCAIGVGDVAGKGMPAALIMASLHSIVRTLVELDLSVVDTIVRLSRLLFRELPANRFATLFYGILDPANHSLTYVNAGHNRPLVVHPDGEIRTLETSGPPVGMFEEYPYEAWSVELGPGDSLLCYSDGVVEAENAAEEQFGDERLREVVREARGRPPVEIIQAIRAVVDAYRGEQPYEDDVTLLALGRDA